MSTSRTYFSTGLVSSSVTISRLLISSCLVLALTACGGGGGGLGLDGAATQSGPPTGGTGSTSGSTGSNGSGATGSGSTTAPATPVYSIGTGSGSGFKDGLIDINKTTLNSGESATLRVNVVDQANNPPSVDLTVSFASSCTSIGLASFGAVTQVTRGLFSVNYLNSGCDTAEDIIVATLTSNGDQASIKVKMVGPDVISVSFVSASPTQLALAGIGGNESTELIFKVAGPQGVPVVGKTVDFSINTQVGGAAILAGRQSATSDQAGQVRTIIKSGTVAGPINVKAVERSSGKQGISPDIIVTTGVVDDKHFSLSISTQNPPDAVQTDGISLSLGIIAGDIFGNDPPDGTRVTFVSPEGGNVTSSCLLSQGTCTVRWLSGGKRPPDKRLSILAYTNGAESFIDNNGNGVFDSTDGAITDLGEPYADINSNGVYDVGDFFFDVNGNGVRDGGNGVWDGPCLSKVDARAVCNGTSTVIVFRELVIALPENGYTIKTQGTFPAVATNITIKQGTSIILSGLVLRDTTDAALPIGNPLPAGTTITFSIEGVGAQVVGLASFTVTNGVTPEVALPAMGITLSADAVVAPAVPSTTTSLVMKASFPNSTSQQSKWPLKITP